MMVRALARPMLASWFVAEGVDVLRHPDRHAAAAEDLLRSAQKLSPTVTVPEPDQVRQLVKMHGAAVALAGAALGTGRMPRLAGLTLAALTFPLALAEQPFASGLSREERRRRRARVTEVAAMTGAALLAAADTAGRPGVGWRLRNARKNRSGD